MDSEKNINVTLTSSDKEDNNEVVISINSIFKNLKAFFLTWLVIAVVLAMILSGIIMLLKKNISSSAANALVNFDYEGVESGLAPDGTKLDVSKIKSPNVIESALSTLGIPLSYVENVRSNISINGVIPNEAKDKFNLYKGSYSNGGAIAIDAVEKIIESSGNPTYYILTFNYGMAGFDVTDGRQILDEIMKSYQEYFFTTYGYNESLGNAIVAIDYTEYDYPAAIDVFSNTLDNLETYVNKLSEETPNFRSGRTGYSLEDIKERIETIKTADLNTLSSYVAVNNVSNDKNVLLSYYQYKIEESTRDMNVCQAELDTYTNSINNYEKNSMVLMGQELYNKEEFDDTSENEEDKENSEDKMFTILSEQYDELVKNKILKQKELSKCKEDIDYYNKRVAALKNSSGSVTDKNREETETRLANLNTRINNLINIVNRTVDEYYETVTFAHAYNILVPAIGSEPWAETKEVLMPVIIIEALVFIVYIMVAFISAIVIDSNAKREKKEAEENALTEK